MIAEEVGRGPEPTFYAWKKKYAGMGNVEMRRVKQLEDENWRLKGLVADLTLDSREKPSPLCFAQATLSSWTASAFTALWAVRVEAVGARVLCLAGV